MRSLLFTDWYELTMGRAYLAEGMEGVGVFELFFRELPGGRNYIVAAGLEDVLSFLEEFEITGEEIDWLRGQEQFRPGQGQRDPRGLNKPEGAKPESANDGAKHESANDGAKAESAKDKELEGFFEWLREVRFEGEVWAVAEGECVFGDEPLVQVVAPIAVGQLLETYILNQVHFQSVLASKAARVVTAAAGRTVVDFGSRRAHGVDAALKAARVSWMAGAAGTSNVLAGRRYGIPVFGTMAHSYVQAHASEAEAFERFAGVFPGTTLLVDTYDTVAGVERAIALKERLGERFEFGAVRLDSGDLVELAKRTRELLDGAGLAGVRIFASSSLDEGRMAELLAAGAPIDGFGVGTELVVSPDAPTLDMAYKLVEYGGRGRLKLSSAKELRPGRKQVWRVGAGGEAERDVVGLRGEAPVGRALLEQVMVGGRRTAAGRRTLAEARERLAASLAELPAAVRGNARAERGYPVEVSAALREETRRVRAGLDAVQ